MNWAHWIRQAHTLNCKGVMSLHLYRQRPRLDARNYCGVGFVTFIDTISM